MTLNTLKPEIEDHLYLNNGGALPTDEPRLLRLLYRCMKEILSMVNDITLIKMTPGFSVLREINPAEGSYIKKPLIPATADSDLEMDNDLSGALSFLMASHLAVDPDKAKVFKTFSMQEQQTYICNMRA